MCWQQHLRVQSLTHKLILLFSLMIRPIGSVLRGSIPIPFFSLKIELFYFHANFKKKLLLQEIKETIQLSRSGLRQLKIRFKNLKLPEKKNYCKNCYLNPLLDLFLEVESNVQKLRTVYRYSQSQSRIASLADILLAHHAIFRLQGRPNWE